MSTKGRGRGKKAASTSVEVTQENVVDSTSEVKSEDESGAGVTLINDKKGSKRKPAAENGSAELTSTVAAKRGRGKSAKEKETPTSEIEDKIVPVEKETKPKRGGRRGTPVESYAEEENDDDADQKKLKGRATTSKRPGRRPGRTSTKTEESDQEKDAEPEPKKATTKGKRGAKKDKAPAPIHEEEEEEAAATNGDDVEDNSNRGTPADEQEDEEPDSPKPAKRGRGRKAAPVKEERKPVKTAGAKKMVTENIKSRKRGGTDSKNEDPSEDGVARAEEEESVPPPAAKKGGGRGRKRAVAESDIPEPAENGNQAQEEEVITAPKKSKKEVKEKPIKVNSTATNYEKIDFTLNKEFNLKISSWNVAGLRSWITKGGLEYIDHEKPDILCLQEIKCAPDQIPDEARIPGYHPYWLCKPGGYAGIGIYSRIMPINVEYGIGDEEQDADGRIMTAEYEKFYLVAVYVPNAGRKLVTLPKRLRWDEIFQAYLTKLNNKKPVIIAGDMNVSHQEIDLANPKTNKKNAGFTQEERDGMTKLLSLGFVDSFRHLYPDKEKAYTFWTYMGGARAKNVGWRLDYFIVSEKLTTKVVDNVMRSQVLGSDHCPITLFLNL